MENNQKIIRDIVVDIRAGLDQAQLVGKYGVSSHAVERIFRTMIRRGLL